MVSVMWGGTPARGVSPARQDRWLKGKPKPVEKPKPVPYRPTIKFGNEPVVPFTKELIATIGRGISGGPNLKRAKTLKAIIEGVAYKHGLEPADLQKPTTSHKEALARHEAVYIAWQRLGLSYSELGRRFKRDHSTIIFSIHQHCRRNGMDPRREVPRRPRKNNKPRAIIPLVPLCRDCRFYTRTTSVCGNCLRANCRPCTDERADGECGLHGTCFRSKRQA